MRLTHTREPGTEVAVVTLVKSDDSAWQEGLRSFAACGCGGCGQVLLDGSHVPAFERGFISQFLTCLHDECPNGAASGPC